VTDWELGVIIDGFRDGSLDVVDLRRIIDGPESWVAESDGSAAALIRGARPE